MPQEDLFAQVEYDLADFQYVGELLATIRLERLATTKELIEHYITLWEITEKLTDEELQKKEGGVIEINPGGFNHTYAKGQKAPPGIDNIIDSLRSQERYMEAILGALKKKYPRQFPKNAFKETLKPKP